MNPPPGPPPPSEPPIEEPPAAAETPKKWRRVIGGIARFFLLVIVGFVAGLAGLVVSAYVYFSSDLPSLEKLKNYSPPIVAQFCADNGELIAEFANERRFVLPIDQMPQTLKDAFISAEDKNFFEHPTMSWWEPLRIAIRAHQCPRCGQSSISQQVVKIFLRYAGCKRRQTLREAILAAHVERTLGKDHILFLYLNQIYLGSSAYGVEAAARTYFDKSVKDLSIAECAMLAGLPKAPGQYSPRRNLEKALVRRNYVLERMFKDGKISEDEYRAALQEQPKINNANPYPKVAPEILEPVRRYVQEKYGVDALYKEGLQVYTTVMGPNSGNTVPAMYVKRIVDRHGKVLEENSAPVLPTREWE